MVGGEHSLKISAPQLLWFGIDSNLNKFPQTITEWMTSSRGEEGVSIQKIVLYRICPKNLIILMKIATLTAQIKYWTRRLKI